MRGAQGQTKKKNMVNILKFRIKYTKVSDKMALADSVDPDWEQSDQGLHCLPFH